MSITPYLTLSDASAAIEFYKKALGATEKARMPAEDGKRVMHAELEIAGGRLFLADDFTNAEKGAVRARQSVFIGLEKAADVDKITDRAESAGAKVNQQPEDMFWGDRFAQFTDPFGHEWMVGAPKG